MYKDFWRMVSCLLLIAFSSKDKDFYKAIGH